MRTIDFPKELSKWRKHVTGKQVLAKIVVLSFFFPSKTRHSSTIKTFRTMEMCLTVLSIDSFRLVILSNIWGTTRWLAIVVGVFANPALFWEWLDIWLATKLDLTIFERLNFKQKENRSS